MADNKSIQDILGDVLDTSGANPVLRTSGGGGASPVTTEGDVIVGDGSGDEARLAIGANETVLTSNGTTATWAAAGGGGSETAMDPMNLSYHTWTQNFVESSAGSVLLDWSSAGTISSMQTDLFTGMQIQGDNTNDFNFSKAFPTIAGDTGNTGGFDSTTRMIFAFGMKWTVNQNDDYIGFGTADGSITGVINPIATASDRACFTYNALDQKLYAVTSDGSSVTATDVDSELTFAGQHNYYIIDIDYTATNTVKFYINGSLVATHTTNLPDGTFSLYGAAEEDGTNDVITTPWNISIKY